VRASHLTTAVLCAGLAACSAPPAGRHADALDLVVRGRDIVLPVDFTVVEARVAPGATLASLLRGVGVVAGDVAAAVDRAASLFDVRKMRAGQPFRLERWTSGAIRTFDYEIDRDRLLRVSRARSAALEAALVPIAKTRAVQHVVGHIDRSAPSLVAAMDAAGETIDLTLAMADILGGEIDFSTEVQPGDRFDVTVEKEYREDRSFSDYGPILAVEFVNAGRRVRAIRFAPEGGQAGYYDERGVSMKRFFLASPLKFQPVVTSAFSRSRFHPILREYRAHLGVDYRAPAGAPVVAVADGVVVAAAMSGGSGRLVHLRHANGFESQYLHLSSIAVHAGMRVRQGELIGRVGSSGLATGPHLDYRLKKSGVYINPVIAHRSMPPADPVPHSQMVAFQALRDRVFSAEGNVVAGGVAEADSAVH
jgi:murein DD-endopeptidase MepM/ murein hydrolase activator NlpD